MTWDTPSCTYHPMKVTKPVTINLPVYLIEALDLIAAQDGTNRTAVMIYTLKGALKIKDGPAPVSAEFWPSGWPKALRIAYLPDATEGKKGPYCNMCPLEHDPMSHPDNPESALEQALVLWKALKAGVVQEGYYLT